MHTEKEYHLTSRTDAKILANGQARMCRTFGIRLHRYSLKFQPVTQMARTCQGHGQGNMTGLVTYICLYVCVCNHRPESCPNRRKYLVQCCVLLRLLWYPHPPHLCNMARTTNEVWSRSLDHRLSLCLCSFIRLIPFTWSSGQQVFAFRSSSAFAKHGAAN